MEATEKQYVFVLKDSAQEMLSMDGAVSEFCVVLADDSLAAPGGRDPEAKCSTHQPIRRGMDLARAACPWCEVYISMLDSFIYLWWLVVFVAMGFGIVNTMLMAVL